MINFYVALISLYSTIFLYISYFFNVFRQTSGIQSAQLKMSKLRSNEDTVTGIHGRVFIHVQVLLKEVRCHVVTLTFGEKKPVEKCP